MEDLMKDRTLEDIHRDVHLANVYRIEYIKNLISIAAGIFVISIAFMSDIIKDIQTTNLKGILVFGWGLLIVSLIGGIFHMRAWDRFYISYRKPTEVGVPRRKRINKYRILFEIIQVGSFLLGVICIFLFAAFNV